MLSMINCILTVIPISTSFGVLSIIIWIFLFILKMFISNLAFALSCVGNKLPQAIMLMIARCQNFKSTN